VVAATRRTPATLPANPERNGFGNPTAKHFAKKKFYLLLQQPELTKQGTHIALSITLMAPRAAEIENAMYDKFRNHVASSNAHTDKAPYRYSLILKKNKDLYKGRAGNISANGVDWHGRVGNLVATKPSREEPKTLTDWIGEANEDKINEMCGIKDLLNASLFTYQDDEYKVGADEPTFAFCAGA
jgi:hypothetical protein